MTQPDLQQLIHLFNDLFSDSYNTVLEAAAQDPYYLPADLQSPYHRVQFAHGFFASALHEISHWCIAGEQRRQQIDFGYWYNPDRTTVQEQKDFEKLEVRPQAFEWIFTVATGQDFFVSADNLHFQEWDLSGFRVAICRQALELVDNGLPKRASQFLAALKECYHTEEKFDGYWQGVRLGKECPG